MTDRPGSGEPACPKCGHDVDHTTPCPEGCPLCDGFDMRQYRTADRPASGSRDEFVDAAVERIRAARPIDDAFMATAIRVELKAIWDAAEARATPPALDVERLAAIEHDQWIAWASSIIESEPGLSPDRIRRWRSLFVPYSELSEDMKDHDRKWARIALARLAPPDDPGAGS